MSAENLLSRLEKVRQTGPGKWSARCPAHDDKGPSLAIRELDDGRVLLHCFAGCGAAEVLQAVGMDFADLYPSTGSFHLQPVKRPFSAYDALLCLAYESLILLQFANHLATGAPLTEDGRNRLRLSATRINAAHGVTQ
jgi:hypothetical protein